MGSPLLQGRTITENDRDGASLVAVIDQRMARKYWRKGEAVGARVRMGLGRNPPWTIIGIVGSVKKRELAERDSRGEIYFPYKQQVPRSVRIVVRGQATTRDWPRRSGGRFRAPIRRCRCSGGRRARD